MFEDVHFESYNTLNLCEYFCDVRDTVDVRAGWHKTKLLFHYKHQRIVTVIALFICPRRENKTLFP